MKIHKILYIFFLWLPFSLLAMKNDRHIIALTAINDQMLQDAILNTVFIKHLNNKAGSVAAALHKVLVPLTKHKIDLEAYKQKKLQKTIRIAQRKRNIDLAFAVLGGITFLAEIREFYIATNWKWKVFDGVCGVTNLYYAARLFGRILNYKKPTMDDLVQKLLPRLNQEYDPKKVLRKII